MEPDISSLAALISEPARGRILIALLDGRSLPATDLAHRAGITRQTASSHLAKLTDSQLLQVIPQGRHRYYRIANARVAELLESMARFAPPKETDRPGPKSPIQIARTCYNHLAGTMGVRLAEAIVGRGLLRQVGRDYQVTRKGAQWFSDLGIDVKELRKSGRAFARQCLDWSERRNHIAGALGTALAEYLFEQGWIEHIRESRAVRVTELGRSELKLRLGLD
ncbi:MAG: winged helix-turn-helix transcriptional regulator [Verrucomicrobia bacterium]|nr:winged helix-turn-helix transcriptional regulator [Verrucomicrobiota bacterium]